MYIYINMLCLLSFHFITYIFKINFSRRRLAWSSQNIFIRTLNDNTKLKKWHITYFLDEQWKWIFYIKLFSFTVKKQVHIWVTYDLINSLLRCILVYLLGCIRVEIPNKNLLLVGFRVLKNTILFWFQVFKVAALVGSRIFFVEYSIHTLIFIRYHTNIFLPIFTDFVFIRKFLLFKILINQKNGTNLI